MPVSLYDMMRPVAIAGGLGAGAGGERGLSLLASVLGGAVFGIAAFVIIGRVANLWFTRLAAQPTSRSNEALFAAVYLAVFFGLLLATIVGSYAGKWVLHEIPF
jgi:hypothetical protein